MAFLQQPLQQQMAAFNGSHIIKHLNISLRIKTSPYSVRQGAEPLTPLWASSPSHQLTLCQPHWPLCTSILKYYTPGVLAHQGLSNDSSCRHASLTNTKITPGSAQRHLPRRSSLQPCNLLLILLSLSSDSVSFIILQYTFSILASRENISRNCLLFHTKP